MKSRIIYCNGYNGNIQDQTRVVFGSAFHTLFSYSENETMGLMYHKHIDALFLDLGIHLAYDSARRLINRWRERDVELGIDSKPVYIVHGIDRPEVEIAFPDCKLIDRADFDIGQLVDEVQSGAE